MFDQVHTPRIVVAGIESGAGKTTVAAGLVAAFRQRGLTVQTFKVGPDYVDAAYLAHVSGRPCRNLDSWMLGVGALRQIFAQGCLGADLAIVEGCLGLFDGRVDGGRDGSTAEVAGVLKALVLLVVDVKGMGGHSAAAAVLGFKQLEPKLKFAGVILNNVLSDEHQRAVEDAIWAFAKLPVLGALPAIEEIAIPERGPVLLPLRENRAWKVAQERLTQAMVRHVDLNLVQALAGRAELLPMVPKKVFTGQAPDGAPTRIAVAYDDAFNFYYPENLEMLAEKGGEVVPFSPLEDEQLPGGIEGIYLGGGFPAVFAMSLSQNRGMALALQRAHGSGIPIYAEGGGLMYLAREVRTNDQARHAMAGVLPIDVEMEDALRRVGYRQVMTLEDSVLSPRGQFFRGHEFHWSRVLPANGHLRPAYRLANAAGELIGPEGLVAPNLLASYVQLHFGQNPILVERFLQRCREMAQTRLAV